MLRSRLALIGCIVAAGVGLAVLAAHNVTTDVTPADRTAADTMMRRAGYGADWKSTLGVGTFDSQVQAILAVQDAVIKATPQMEQIPFDVPREPADLLARAMGDCSERSRSIEKLLNILGLETRHAAIYSTVETGSRFLSLLTPRIDSHAVTEVRTAKGWMVVDSTSRWIGLTIDNSTISLDQLRDLDHEKAAWHTRLEDRPHTTLQKPYTYVIGLYSRHGRFFAPYTPVPDINWPDFLAGQLS